MGGDRRTFEALKYFSEFGFIPILYIPYSDLMSAVMLEEVYRLEKYAHILKSLERFNVIVPNELYENIENIRSNVQYYFDYFQKKGMLAVASIIKRSIQSVQGFKDIISSAKKFLTRLIRDNGIDSDKLEFVYSMHECPSFVTVGSFLAKSLKKKLYIQLQLEPFKPFREFVIDDWISRVTFGEQQTFREIARLFLFILQSVLSDARYSYSYAFRNNLHGLLAVSEAPLIISGLDFWARERGIRVKIVRPGNAVEEEFCKYINERERCRVLRKKEDVAVYWTRLRSSKGLFDILSIARKLAVEGYRLMVIGRFDNIVEKRIFFRICEEKKIKNIEYLGWLPREKLIEVVSRSKVLIYPSHSDAFSLVVLEALFLGCSVVAYDIPAIRSVYKGLKPVKIMKEYDYKAMAEEAIKILKRDVSKHEEEHLDDNFMNFLKMHSSWRNVAKADIEAIREMMNYPSRTCC
ncbi:MAG: glycosyltransferase [Nitrososphaerota archaeon]